MSRMFETYCYLCGCPLSGLTDGSKSHPVDPKLHDWMKEVTVLRNGKPALRNGRYDGYGNVVWLKPDGRLYDESSYRHSVNLYDYKECTVLMMRSKAVHDACHQIAEEPTWKDLMGLEPSMDFVREQGQDFDWEAVVKQGKTWKLVDPMLESQDGQRNWTRIYHDYQVALTKPRCLPVVARSKKAVRPVVDRTGSLKMSQSNAQEDLNKLTKKQLLNRLDKMRKSDLIRLLQQ